MQKPIWNIMNKMISILILVVVVLFSVFVHSCSIAEEYCRKRANNKELKQERIGAFPYVVVNKTVTSDHTTTYQSSVYFFNMNIITCFIDSDNPPMESKR